MGHKAKLDKLAGALGWNQKSELRKAYGMLRVVIQGHALQLSDPSYRLYLGSHPHRPDPRFEGSAKLLSVSSAPLRFSCFSLKAM